MVLMLYIDVVRSSIIYYDHIPPTMSRNHLGALALGHGQGHVTLRDASHDTSHAVSHDSTIKAINQSQLSK